MHELRSTRLGNRDASETLIKNLKNLRNFYIYPGTDNVIITKYDQLI